MKSPTRVLLCASALCVLPTMLPSQERALGGLKPLAVRVHVDRATLTGDVTTIGYTVENIGVGGENLWGLLVATPGSVLEMPAVRGQQWATQPRYRGRPIVGWMFDSDTLLRPGQSSVELTVVARGIPDLVQYWAVPDLMAHPPRYQDDDPKQDAYLDFADTGTTIGIVPMPTSATPASLATRLHALAARACGRLGWISRPGVCQSLDVKLAHVESALASGQTAVARNELGAFLDELDAQHGPQPGKAVSDEAHALLSLNATFLLARL